MRDQWSEVKKRELTIKVYGLAFFLCLLASLLPVSASLSNKPHENQKQFSKEISSNQYTSDNRNFSGKKVYHLGLYGWQVEAIYVNGKSISETARPKGDNLKKTLITEKEANVIADMLYPKKARGLYRKQIKNANFISHFFENGVISYEMALDKRRKNHIGIVGVRAVLYSNGAHFKDIKVNAYH